MDWKNVLEGMANVSLFPTSNYLEEANNLQAKAELRSHLQEISVGEAMKQINVELRIGQQVIFLLLLICLAVMVVFIYLDLTFAVYVTVFIYISIWVTPKILIGKSSSK